MKTSCFIHPTRFIKAVFILLLCGLLAVVVFADDYNHKQRILGPDSLEQSAQAMDANDQKPDLHQTSAYRPDSKDKDKDKDKSDTKSNDSGSKSGSEEHKINTAPKEDNNPPPPKPDNNNNSSSNQSQNNNNSSNNSSSSSSSNNSQPPPSSNYHPAPKPDNNNSSSSGSQSKQDNNSSNQSNSQPAPPANVYRPDTSTSNSGNSGSKAGSTEHTVTATPKSNDSGQGQKSGTNTSNSGSYQHKVNTGQTEDIYHPSSNTRNPVSYEHKINTNQNDKPRDYHTPGHREKGHYYSSRSNPCYYRYWVFDNYDYHTCRRSVYYNYGYFPYVQVTQIQSIPYTTPSYQTNRVVSEKGSYLSRYATPLDMALMDIRDAWMTGRYEMIDKHLDVNRKIAVFLDGKYDYSISTYDYADMTSDALEDIETLFFMWDDIRQRTNGDYTAFGKHVFYDINRNVQAIHVSYTLQRAGQDYVIIEVGSSNSPLL